MPKRTDRKGVVYSTDPAYEYRYGKPREPDMLPPPEQKLRVTLDKKARRGKAVTLVTGFVGPEAALGRIGKKLKSACGVGGSVKDNEIVLQGDHRAKVIELLKKDGYTGTKQSGG